MFRNSGGLKIRSRRVLVSEANEGSEVRNGARPNGLEASGSLGTREQERSSLATFLRSDPGETVVSGSPVDPNFPLVTR